jgi:LCP family protein required for cell wall assembly
MAKAVYKKRKKVSGFAKGLIITFVLVLLIAFAALFVLQKFSLIAPEKEDIWSKIKPIEGTTGEIYDEFKNVKRINLLVAGVEEHLSDTLMLASYDMDVKKLDVISVPRDTLVEREDDDPNQGVAFNKINSYYGTGGATATALAVSKVLDGTPIHYYAVITDGGIIAVVDAMGGVKIDVPMDMYYTDARRGLYIDLQKGEQVLDGEKAIQYLRFRKGYPEGDTGRVKAQQKFVKEVFKQSIGLGFPKVADTVLKSVIKNISVEMALKIAGTAVGLDTDSLKIQMIPGDTSMIDGGSFYLNDEDKTAELIRGIYLDSIKTLEEIKAEDSK